MFFINTLRNKRRSNGIMSALQPSYDIKRWFKIGKVSVPLAFPSYRVAIDFGEYNKEDKKTKDIENSGYIIVNIPRNEDIFMSIGRILYVLKNIESKSKINKNIM